MYLYYANLEVGIAGDRMSLQVCVICSVRVFLARRIPLCKSMASKSPGGLTFNLKATIGAPAQAEPGKEWLPGDARNRFKEDSYFGVSSYLGGHAGCLEVVASRIFYILNGCSYYAVETFVVSGMRVIGWAARLAFFLTSLLFCFLSLTTEVNPILHFSSFSRTRDSENELTDNVDPALFFVQVVYYVLITNLVVVVLTYLVGRFSRTPHEGQCSILPWVLFNRSPFGGGKEDEGNCCLAGFVMTYFIGLGIAAGFVIHTCVAHAYIARNRDFLLLLGILVLFDVLSAVADAVSIGSIDGLRVTSSSVSWLVSFRILVLIPLQIIFTSFFIFVCLPGGL